ncbi:hypothetical protein DOE76_18635 [Leifsonia sp. ku-ls]|nr:hypothetical protein DOE76_18635 [Leifsonia sp. ku-ls]
MAADDSHEALAARLRSRVRDTGTAPQPLREVAFALGASRDTAERGPIADLAALVGSASFLVTDAQVREAREEAGSEVATFEVVMSASVGAGLARWDAASRSIEEATDAAS